MLFLDNQLCPVCGQRGSGVLHIATYPEHHYHGPFVMRCCNGCGLLFNSPRIDQEELGRFYGRNYYFFLRKDAREFARIVAMYQRTIALIASDIREKRCLDIGCGRGYFPAILKQLGYDAAGVEISEDAAAYARKAFGLDIFTGTIEEYAASNQAKQFPLLTAIDVIEHVPSPEAFIEAMVKCVAPGGWLIIDTPNAAARNIQLKGVSWKGFNPFHIYLFSADHLTRLLGRHGMTVQKSFSYGNTPTPLDARDRSIAMLRKTHLLKPTVAGYFQIKKMTISNGDPWPHINAAVARINSEPAWNATADATAPFSGEKAGDNVVVIARKP